MAVSFMYGGCSLVDLEEISRVPVPAKTRSYCPVPYGVLVDMIKSRVAGTIGLPCVEEQYALSRVGKQMFGTMTFKDPLEDEYGISFGFGSCYDMSIKLRFAAGLGIFMCSNLCYSGDAVTYARKHTTHIMKDLEFQICEALNKTKGSFQKMKDQMNGLKAIPCSIDRGYELIGLAEGHGVIKSQVASVARKDWTNPRVLQMNKVVDGIKTSYECQPFTENNMYSLYNCFTEGAKKGSVGKRVERQTGIHSFLMNTTDVAAGSLC